MGANWRKLSKRMFRNYLNYAVFIFSIMYLRKKDVPENVKMMYSSEKFKGNGPCVDRVSLVEEPLTSLSTRIHILSSAEKTIDISYFAIQMGKTTDYFLGAILDAADRGVHVRILVDGASGGLTRSNKEYAVALGAHPNIDLKVYNPPDFLKPWTYNGRLHDKYIIIDNKLLLLGGRNIGDKYFNPIGYDKNISIDRDVLIYNTEYDKGSSASVLFQVRSYMSEIWHSAYVSMPFSQESNTGRQKRKELSENFSMIKKAYPTLFDHSHDDYEKTTFEANRITFLHNPIKTTQKNPTVAYALQNLMLTAKKSVTLQSPYVVLDDGLKKFFRDLGKKGIDCRLLTNSVASTLNMPAYSMYYIDKKELLQTGLRVWEYQSQNAIHAKTYLIDGRISAVGSFNLDPRSAYIDTELMLVIDSKDFTEYLSGIQSQYFNHSLEVGCDGKYIQRSDIEEAKVNPAKKTAIKILSVPMRFFKYLV
ncbi:MAG: phosphatidylserine/phosphatidylglycerophosphate/cardiolipin synthase family protein [Clostridiales bacterium]|nr:phosphatidylserine/phosphatidylglycerophosphate/cardiolipin synthase family protein [Clostridiales bacterium]